MKKGLVILVILLIIIVGVVFWVKEKIKKIIPTTDSFDVTRITQESIRGYFVLRIPNPFLNVVPSDLDVDLYIDGKHISKITKSNPLVKTDDQALYVRGDFSLKYKNFSLEEVAKLLTPGKKEYQIIGTVKINKFGLQFKIPIDYTDTLNLKQ